VFDLDSAIPWRELRNGVLLQHHISLTPAAVFDTVSMFFGVCVIEQNSKCFVDGKRSAGGLDGVHAAKCSRYAHNPLVCLHTANGYRLCTFFIGGYSFG